MKKIAILQSNYLPWKGYFDLIHDVDLCLFYDQVQFTKNDWRNRNRIKTPAGLLWLTVPVGADIHRRIDAVEIPDRLWATKHWKTIRQYYSRAPHFHRYEEYLRWFYLDNEWRNLSEMNQRLILHIAREWLGIRTDFAQAPEARAPSPKAERVLDLIRSAGGDLYVSGPAARCYLEAERFRAGGVEIVWKDYSGYPEYAQPHPPFEHAVSIIDLLFQVGPDAPAHIWGWRDREALRQAN